MTGDLRAIKAQLNYHRKLTGAYPTTEQGLKVTGTELKDYWGNDYFYSRPGRRYRDGYDLLSVGPDGVVYTADDDWGE
jgi:hypothetical protein